MLNRKLFLSLLIIFVCSTLVTLNYSDLFTKEDVKQLQYTGKEDHSITLEEASNLTQNFQLQASPDQVIAGYFGKEAILAILSQESAVGMRCYYALDADGISHLVIVGVNAKGNDMTDGLLAQRMTKCPPYCPELNELNSPLVNSNFAANF